MHERAQSLRDKRVGVRGMRREGGPQQRKTSGPSLSCSAGGRLPSSSGALFTSSFFREIALLSGLFRLATGAHNPFLSIWQRSDGRGIRQIDWTARGGRGWAANPLFCFRLSGACNPANKSCTLQTLVCPVRRGGCRIDCRLDVRPPPALGFSTKFASISGRRTAQRRDGV